MNRKQIALQLKSCFFSIGMIAVFLPLMSNGQTAPTPVGPVPNARQIEWYHRGMIAFFSFWYEYIYQR